MKKRLDMLMMERALAPSREKAKAFIMAGDVYAVSYTHLMEINLCTMPLQVLPGNWKGSTENFLYLRHRK